MLPDPKRPRLLAPGDEASSTQAAVPTGAPSGLARGNYAGRAPGPAPSRVPARYERASYPATQHDTASQRVQGSLSQSSAAARTRATSTGGRPSVPPPSSSTSSVLPPPPRKSGVPFTDQDDRDVVTYLSTSLPDIVIAALMERTPREIQTRISLLIRWHEHDMTKGPQMRPPYKAEDYKRLLRMYRTGASAERIALVLDRSTGSVMSHFQKHKPVWNAAGERVEALTLLRDNEIDHEERVRAELAGPLGALARKIAQDRLVPDATRPALPTTPSGPPSTCANPPLAGTATTSGMPRPLLAQPSFAKPPLASNASDPNVPTLLPTRSDNSTRSVPDGPVPHHAGHLDHLPLWHDEHYEQAMFGLERFLRLVKNSRRRTRSASNSRSVLG